MPDPAPRRGRRPAGEDTRALIVDAACAEFAAKGYDRASIRGIARTAGVDPSLVHHYFDGKTGLFAAAMALPVDPHVVAEGILEQPVARRGQALVRAFLGTWETPEARPRMEALLRSAAGQADMAELLRGFLLREVFRPLVGGMGEAEADRRAGLVASQMIGLAFTRYVVPVPGVADRSTEELVADIAPTIQRYLEL